MKSLIYYITFLLVGSAVWSQSILQPAPKKMQRFNESVTLSFNQQIYVLSENDSERRAANYLFHVLPKKFKQVIPVEETESWKVRFMQLQLTSGMNNEQYYSIFFDKASKTVQLSSPSQLGLLYAAVTLANLSYEGNDELKVDIVEIEDYPTNKRREFVANPSADDIPSLFDFALKNKFETVVLASRQHPWYGITDKYLALLGEIKKWKDKFGGPRVMQSHNIYEGPDIVISNEEDVNNLKEVIEVSYKHGVEKLMILSDDTPPFKFGEGYILTDENDKKTFPHFEAANTYLMNELVRWFNEEEYNIETYYVPAFYTYEDMHHGDVELFIGTPWEEGAFEPFFRDLQYLGANLNEEVFIIWTGPYVRTRKLTADDIVDWTENLNGRVPFLWDNTIYSHHPFTSTPLLTAWYNEFPTDFAEITAGNGMFVNGDVNSESALVAAITTNDYLWNPQTYHPQRSLENAVAREYGKGLVNLILQFKNTELNLRKTIGERKLWFEADTLWRQIREVRFVTDKNPFYYHLNYTRMKALRLQLKASVPEPKSKEDFIKECKAIDNKRHAVLTLIRDKDIEVYNRLKEVVEPLPDFERIQ